MVDLLRSAVPTEEERCTAAQLAAVLGFWVWVFGFLGFWVFGFLGFWVFGFLGFWVLGFLGFWV